MAPILKLFTLLNRTSLSLYKLPNIPYTNSYIVSIFAAAQGKQFITGACTSDAACASGCCGFTSGKCAAPLVAQERGEGCGFGDAQSNNNALNAQKGASGNAGNASNNNNNANTGNTGNNNNNNATADAGTGNANNANNGGNMQAESSTPAAPTPAAKGKQFITGPCTSDADCASACCGFKSGKCAGPVVAQERDGGCGFGNAQPNDNAAKALQGRKLGRRGPMFM